MPASTSARVFTADDNRFGWTVGVGVEYAFSPAWSTKLEFDYIDLGSRSTAFTDQALFSDRSNIAIEQTLYRMKAGID
jgi:opacity protein-like surface antigen